MIELTGEWSDGRERKGAINFSHVDFFCPAELNGEVNGVDIFMSGGDRRIFVRESYAEVKEKIAEALDQRVLFLT